MHVLVCFLCGGVHVCMDYRLLCAHVQCVCACVYELCIDVCMCVYLYICCVCKHVCTYIHVHVCALL